MELKIATGNNAKWLPAELWDAIFLPASCLCFLWGPRAGLVAPLQLWLLLLKQRLLLGLPTILQLQLLVMIEEETKRKAQVRPEGVFSAAAAVGAGSAATSSVTMYLRSAENSSYSRL